MADFKGIVRHKDGTKGIYEISGVKDWHDARLSLLHDLDNIQCALVLVPKEELGKVSKV